MIPVPPPVQALVLVLLLLHGTAGSERKICEDCSRNNYENYQRCRCCPDTCCNVDRDKCCCLHSDSCGCVDP